MTLKRKPWVLAIAYVAVSLAIEAALMVVGHLKVPQDNSVLAPVVLTIPPALTSWLCGYRQVRQFLIAAVLLSILTLVLTALFGRLTGVSTGMAEPIFNRALAGFLAGVIVNRTAAGNGAR